MTFVTEDIFMHIKENATGIQHIGIPTKDMDAHRILVTSVMS